MWGQAASSFTETVQPPIIHQCSLPINLFAFKMSQISYKRPFKVSNSKSSFLQQLESQKMWHFNVKTDSNLSLYILHCPFLGTPPCLTPLSPPLSSSSLHAMCVMLGLNYTQVHQLRSLLMRRSQEQIVATRWERLSQRCSHPFHLNKWRLNCHQCQLW